MYKSLNESKILRGILKNFAEGGCISGNRNRWGSHKYAHRSQRGTGGQGDFSKFSMTEGF